MTDVTKKDIPRIIRVPTTEITAASAVLEVGSLVFAALVEVGDTSAFGELEGTKLVWVTFTSESRGSRKFRRLGP